MNQVEEWAILLWVLLPLVLTALPLALGSISCSSSYPKSFPRDDLHAQPEAP